MSDNSHSGQSLELLASVGLVTLMWAKAEGILDSICTIIFFKGGGDRLEKMFPRALDRKLQFLRKASKEIKCLKELENETNELLDSFHSLKSKRHDIVHGYVGNITDIDFTVSVLKKDKKKTRGFSFDSQKITQTDLDKLLREINDLCELTEGHFNSTFRAILGEDIEDGMRSLSN